MFEVEKYVEFLKGLKANPELVLVSGIVGVDDERHTVVVGPDPMTPANPSVQKSCFISDPGDPNDGAAPPIRLGAFLGAFPNGSTRTSICSATLEDALVEIAERLRVLIFDPCVKRPLRDVEPERDGLQPECSVMDVRNPHGDDREEVVIPSCDATPGTVPCWRIAPDLEHCPTEPGNLAIVVERGGQAPPSNTYLEAQCVAE